MSYQRRKSNVFTRDSGSQRAAAATSRYTTAKNASAMNGRSSIDQAKFMGDTV